MAEVDYKTRMIFIDEAHIFLKFPQLAEFLAKLLKEARKKNLIPVILSQDTRDFTQNLQGKNVLSNVSVMFVGRTTYIDSDELGALVLDDNLKHSLKNLRLGQFYVDMMDTNFFMETNFLNDRFRLICDTQETYYKDTMSDLE